MLEQIEQNNFDKTMQNQKINEKPFFDIAKKSPSSHRIKSKDNSRKTSKRKCISKDESYITQKVSLRRLTILEELVEEDSSLERVCDILDTESNIQAQALKKRAISSRLAFK